MSTNVMPAGASGGQVTRGRQPSCLPHDITVAIDEQLEALRLLVTAIDKEQCYPAWELARKDYLNAQSAAWEAGRRP